MQLIPSAETIADMKKLDFSDRQDALKELDKQLRLPQVVAAVKRRRGGAPGTGGISGFASECLQIDPGLIRQSESFPAFVERVKECLGSDVAPMSDERRNAILNDILNAPAGYGQSPPAKPPKGMPKRSTAEAMLSMGAPLSVEEAKILAPETTAQDRRRDEVLDELLGTQTARKEKNWDLNAGRQPTHTAANGAARAQASLEAGLSDAEKKELRDLLRGDAAHRTPPGKVILELLRGKR